MSLSLPTGNKPLTDAELAQLATSPTWSQSPNGWFDRSANEEDDHLADGHTKDDYDGKFDQPGFLDDMDGTDLCSSRILSILSVGTHLHTIACFCHLRHFRGSVSRYSDVASDEKWVIFCNDTYQSELEAILTVSFCFLSLDLLALFLVLVANFFVLRPFGLFGPFMLFSNFQTPCPSAENYEAQISIPLTLYHYTTGTGSSRPMSARGRLQLPLYAEP